MLAALALGLAVGTPAAEPMRGPYFADASSTSVSVCASTATAFEFECRPILGLSPGATFSYGLDGASGTWVGRTLPGPGARLRFAAFGDLGAGSPEQAQVAAAVETADPDLVLLPGDIMYPKGEPKDYDAKYFPVYRRLLARIPFFPSPGNHDYGNYRASARRARERAAEGYGRVFRRPAYYSFDAGDVHFVSLDTNREGYAVLGAESIGPDSDQLEWLERDLSASKARWKVVFFHVPMFGAARHGEHEVLRDLLAPLFKTHGVDLVLQGHDHVYERRGPIDGTLYVTVGTGGARLRRIPWPDRSVKERRAAFGFAQVVVDGPELALEFIGVDGRVLDRATLSKR